MSATSSRGYRNRNPGNIDFNPRNNWQGQVGIESSGNPPRFAVFETHEFGIRALCALLTTYQTRHNLRTIAQMISRWAPPSGSVGGRSYTQNTEGYIAHVERLTGFKRDQVLDMRRYDHAMPLVKAVITHELGGQPYDQAVIDKGLELYGVVKNAVRPVATMRDAAQTGTGRGAIEAGTATALAGTVGTVAAGLQGLDWRIAVALIVAAAVATVVWILARRRG